MPKSSDLRGKVIVITGGSRGIGRAAAAQFVKAGATVAIGARDLPAARRAATQIGAHAYPLDVTDQASVNRFLATVEAEHGPVDVFVNNAGVMLVGRFETEAAAATEQQLSVNLLGTIHGMRSAMTVMRPRGRGHIINMVSAVGMVGLPGCATYSAAKHGIVGLSEGVRGELRGSGLKVSIILPIPASTELTTGVGKGRFVPVLSADTIAAAVVRTARRPRYHVYVPGWTNPVTRILGLLPQAWRDAAGRLLKADQLLRTTDFTARAGYETQVAVAAEVRTALAEVA